MTTVKISRRLSMHLQCGAPKKHLMEKHGMKLTRNNLDENTEILAICSDNRRLQIMEALFIKENNPNMNQQHIDLQALPSMRRTTTATEE